LKVLITGGTGTIGSSFIKRFPKHEYFSISRNETFIVDLCRKNKSIKNYIGSIEDKSFLIKTFKEIEPDIVIHAAAIKHIDIAEKNPIQTCKINIIGSIKRSFFIFLLNYPSLPKGTN